MSRALAGVVEGININLSIDGLGFEAFAAATPSVGTAPAEREPDPWGRRGVGGGWENGGVGRERMRS